MRTWEGGFKMKLQLTEGVLSGQVHFLYIQSLVNKIILISFYVDIHSIIVLWNTTKKSSNFYRGERRCPGRHPLCECSDRRDSQSNTLPSRCDILASLPHIHRPEQFSTCPSPDVHSLNAGRQHRRAISWPTPAPDNIIRISDID